MKNLALTKRIQFALSGIKNTWASEASFRTQSLIAVLVLISLFILMPSPIWWAILLSNIGIVLSLELLNTALEKLVDFIHPEIHPMIKIAKDSAAGAVLLMSLISSAVYLCFVLTYSSQILDLIKKAL